MTDRPYVLLSCAMSLDGYIDDASRARLVLSNDDDLDRVDAVRAGCDAIMVGAGTIRADDPRLLVRSARRRRDRVARGMPPHPTKVTLTATGDLDPACRFLTTGDTPKLVYTSDPPRATARLAAAMPDAALRDDAVPAATVLDGGDPIELSTVLADLRRRGVGRLLVEGGTSLHTQFLAADLADELHLAIAPFLVGDPAAPRFVGPGTFAATPTRPLYLADTRRLGSVAVLRYLRRSPGEPVSGPGSP